MSSVSDRIEALSQLGTYLQSESEALKAAKVQARLQNAWFSDQWMDYALKGVADSYLNKENLTTWTAGYPIEKANKQKVGLVLAGNIPLVGIHDMLCAYVVGHTISVKLSSKDTVLMSHIIDKLKEFDPSANINVVGRLEEFDAVIATGSGNTSLYFKQYFGKVPHIIRKNRNAIAILDGSETEEDLINLGMDVFAYFGLGCRNISKLYVPEGYDMTPLIETLHERYKDLILHHKYKNNFDYNYALFMLNKEEFLMSGSMLFRKSSDIASRIASINYENYSDIEKLTADLRQNEEKIQCISTNMDLGNLKTVGIGEAQKPSLTDYADGVDTMEFLTEL